MIRTTLIAMLASAAAFIAAPANAQNEEGKISMEAQTITQPAPKKSGHVAANGVNYYYEIRGEGEPLLLLHGGLGTIDMFAPIMPVLAEGREGDRRRSPRARPHPARRARNRPHRYRR
jgi:hypothetical protein